MQQGTNEIGNLYLLGGDNIRFLVEEPVRMALEGLKVVNFESERDFTREVKNAVSSLTPVCLVAGAESLSTSISEWTSNCREQFPWLPIVVLDQCDSRATEYEFLPQLVESVAVIRYPYTQKAVIDAIEKSIWWSRNLCRMLERVTYFTNLSERELAIVSMATDGVPNKSMARRLEVSIKTIEKNRRTAYEKLSISSSAEMAALVTFRRYFNRSIEQNRNQVSPLMPNIAVNPTLPFQVMD